MVYIMLNDNWKLVLRNDFKGQWLGFQTACTWSPITGRKINYSPLESPGVSCIVWNNSFRRARSEVFEKGKTKFPDKFCQVPPALQMPHKQNVSFPMAVLWGPDHTCVFRQIISSRQDLEGRLIHRESKASSIGTTVYLKFKCISDLRVIMHNTAWCSQQLSGC